eukprot:c5225_g2_i1 orf=4-216(-)
MLLSRLIGFLHIMPLSCPSKQNDNPKSASSFLETVLLNCNMYMHRNGALHTRHKGYHRQAAKCKAHLDHT